MVSDEKKKASAGIHGDSRNQTNEWIRILHVPSGKLT